MNNFRAMLEVYGYERFTDNDTDYAHDDDDDSADNTDDALIKTSP